ncbi:MAG: PASTA domain-containing protein [Bacteroidales bacterium]|nr:PASTA domain-containing protein [Bacteroidales bacterium]
MAKKIDWKEIFSNWIVRNVLLGALFVTVLIVVASIFLHIATRHGKTVEVPDFINMTPAEAEVAASKGGVEIKVADSVFVRRLSAGAVFRQNPKAGSRVKKGRMVFLTINSVVPRTTTMPNLIGYSLVQAKAEIVNHGLSLGRLDYVSDMATNNVLGQKCGGKVIAPGKKVIAGSEIDLTVGLNPSDSRTTIPYLSGMKYISAMDAIHDSYLNVGRVRFDEGIRTYADSLDAVVYRQDGPPRASRTMGTAVAIWLTNDLSKVPTK